jgi:hypothetical protein
LNEVCIEGFHDIAHGVASANARPPVARLTTLTPLVTIRRRTDAIWLSIGVLGLLLTLLVNLVCHVPPLQDLNDWVYQGYVIRGLVSGEAVPAALKYWPVPNAFSQLVLAPMTWVLSPIATAKTFASLYLVISGWVMFWLSRRSDTTVDGLRFLLLICLAVVHSPYWAGEINYQIGLTIFACYMVTDCRRRQPSFILDTVTAVLLFLCHALCLGIFLIYITWRLLMRGKALQSVASTLPSIVLLLWYAAMDPRPDRVDPNSVLNVEPRLSGVVDWIGYHLYVFAKVGPYQNLLVNNIGDFERFKAFYFVGVVINVLFAAAMGLLFITWVARSWQDGAVTVPLLTALSCAVVAIINPGRTLGIGNGTERFLYPTLIIAVLFFCGPSRWRRFAGVFGAFLPVFAAYLLIMVPRTAPLREVPDWSAMNRSDARPRILFWHRPYMYLPQIEAAQEAAMHGTTPTADILYQTSILRHKPEPGATAP